MKKSTSFAQVANNLLNVLQGYTKSIRLLLVMFLTLTVTTNAWGYTGTFEKITSTSQLTTGYYVIVASADAKAVGNTVDSNKRIAGVNVTISNNNITNPDDAIVYYIAKSGDNYTFKNVGNSKYLYQASTSSGKGMGFTSESKNITCAGYNANSPEGFKFTLNGGSNNYFKWNKSSTWFANYSNDYTTSMTPVRLYKLAEVVKTTTITINPNTSNHGTGSNVSVTATYGQALPSFTACTPATGYELAGYYTSATGGTKVIGQNGKLVASVSGYTDANAKWINERTSLTLYAQYSAKNYTVKYAGNSGTTTCTGGSYTYNTSFTICSDEPTRTGYSFTGWSDGTKTYQPGANYTMPAENVTFTAQWQINTYTVTWIVDGVTKRTDTGVAYNTSKTAPTVSPIPCGDVIAGWTDAVDGNYEHNTSTLHSGATPSITITSDKTFYAVFADYEN